MSKGSFEEFVEALQKVTSNVRHHHGDDEYVEIYFNANDYTNYGEGYEAKVLAVVKEHAYMVHLLNHDMTLEAEFEPELQ